MVDKVLFSSESVEWATPQDLYEDWNELYHFDIDVCATDDNTKCEKYFNEIENALIRNWHLHGSSAWMNPPYSRPEQPCKKNCKKKGCEKRGYHNDEYTPGLEDWIKKAYEESQLGMTVVCLLPARIDTHWYHKYAKKGTVYAIKGRIKFIGADNAAPFPSIILVFERKPNDRKYHKLNSHN